VRAFASMGDCPTYGYGSWGLDAGILNTAQLLVTDFLAGEHPVNRASRRGGAPFKPMKAASSQLGVGAWWPGCGSSSRVGRGQPTVSLRHLSRFPVSYCLVSVKSTVEPDVTQGSV
jgi:hypothetical protein